MKTFKIVLGFLLLYGVGKEYINASRQLGSLISPGIIIATLIFLILATWLIGSAFSARKFTFLSFEFVKFFFISFVFFAAVAIFSLGSKSEAKNFVTINELKIPLGKCIDGNKKIIPNYEDREEYCRCFVEKITNDSDLKKKYQDDLINDKVTEVFEKIKSNPKFQELGIKDCASSIKMKWTEYLANSMKKNWKKELLGSEFETTNNVDKYCDCLLNEFQKHPLHKVIEQGYTESQEGIDIIEKCTSLSLK